MKTPNTYPDTPQVHHTAEAFAEATGFSIEMVKAHKITSYNSASGIPLHVLRLPWGERRALGVELDGLYETLWRDVTEEHRDRAEEIESILEANPLDSYPSEEIDAYNIEHFGDASGRPAEKKFLPGSGVQDMGRSGDRCEAHNLYRCAVCQIRRDQEGA